MIKRDQRGFTLIELLVALAIVALIAGAAVMTIFQVINVTKSSNDRMTVIRQVQNAGYWISHDTQMAQYIDSAASFFEPEQDDIWKLTIRAHSGTQTETREYEINPRVNI